MRVFDDADIASLAAPDRLDQLLELVPNVQIGSGGEGPAIRGLDTTGPMRDLPAFLGGNRPRTTLIIDGRPAGYNELAFGVTPLWDVERLEVFRSPQTTTQGPNSIAGAIFVHTADPTFVPEQRARAIAGSFRARQLSAAVNAPIVADQFAFRVAGDYRYSKPASELAELARGADPNRDEFALVRFKLLATPTVLKPIRVEFTFAHTESQAPQIEGVRQPFRERRDPLATYGIFRIRTDAATASVSYDIPNLRLTSMLSRGRSKIRRFAPPGLGETEIGESDWSGEVIADWSPSGDLQLIGGTSHLRKNARQFIDLSVLLGRGDFRDVQDGTGVFGEGRWKISPRATFTVGLRYQHDTQQRVGSIGAGPELIALDYDRSFSAWLPKLSFSYDLSRAVVAGLLVQRAYNPGGATLRVDTGRLDTFEAETLWDYELFVRASLAGGALSASANLFHYDIRNAQRAEQIFIRSPSGPLIGFADMFNVPRARTRGLEVGLDWRASRRLSAKLGIGFLDTQITRADAAFPAYEGKSFQRAPRLSLSGAADWRPVDRLRLSAQLRHTSGYFSDDLNVSARHIEGGTRLDARVQWDTRHFSAFGYARNLFNRFYMTYLFSPTFGTAGDPRELGLGIEKRF